MRRSRLSGVISIISTVPRIRAFLWLLLPLTLEAKHQHNVTFTYNRKEAKDHGEGGSLVGDQYENARAEAGCDYRRRDDRRYVRL